MEYIMRVKSNHFHHMRGHVCDGCVIVAPSGKEFRLRNTIRGWIVDGPDGQPCSGYLDSVMAVEVFMVNGLQTH